MRESPEIRSFSRELLAVDEIVPSVEIIRSTENPFSLEEIKKMSIEVFFDNYANFSKKQRECGQKGTRNLNQNVKKFWREVDCVIQDQTGKSFFEWFYYQYMEEQLGIKDIHQLFSARIKPLKLAYSAFYKFITQRAFVDTRDRSESLQTGIAQRRLDNRKRPAELTKEQLSERSKKGWGKVPQEERGKRNEKAWQTRRSQVRESFLKIVDDLPN